MKNSSSIVAIACALVLPVDVLAEQNIYECPHSIPETSVQLTPPDQDWKSFISSPLYLSGAAPADGPPERLGILREDDFTKTKAGWTRKYSLIGQYPEGKWLRCDYGSLGEMSLAKRLPDEIKECTVTGKKGDHAGEMLVQVRCR